MNAEANGWSTAARAIAEQLIALFGDAPITQTDTVGALDLFGWEDLNTALSYQRLEWPRLRVVAGGETVPQESYSSEIPRRVGTPYRTLDTAKLNGVLMSGATLVIDGINQLHSGVDVVASHLSSFFHAPVLVNLYASWGSVEGFDLHWDDHEVFVLQLSGTKDWHVHEPTREWPLWLDVADAPRPAEAAFLRHTLEPGDRLYVPHGWWHMANAVDSPSLHLTFGVTRPTGIDYLEWITDKLRASREFRRPVPLLNQTNVEDAEQFSSRLAAEIQELVLSEEAGLAAFTRDRDAYARPAGRFSLPSAAAQTRKESVPAWRNVRWLAPRAVVTVGEQVTVSFGGTRLVLSSDAADLIQLLQSELSMSFRDVVDRVSLAESKVVGLVGALVRHGLAQVS